METTKPGFELRKAKKSQLIEILKIQKIAFKTLYLKYRDDTSPYLDELEDIIRKFQMKRSHYYFIVREEKVIGFIRIILNEKKTKARISPLALLPMEQSKGYGKQVMLQVEQEFPTIKYWYIETIKEETDLVSFYQGLGYQPLGREDVITSEITLVYYVKQMREDQQK